ncbi:hypothetical protein CBL_08270 [Carabus blaptoides fortunei]
MQTTYLLVVFAVVVQQTIAGDIRESLKKCKASDPNFDECVLTSANAFMSTILKGKWLAAEENMDFSIWYIVGDDKNGIPPLMVSNQTSILNCTEKFNLKFTNLSAHCDEGFVIKSLHFGISEKLLTLLAKCSQLRHDSNYEAVGEILGKPAHENGKVNMTFDDVELNVSMPFEFKTKDDKKYLEAVSCKLEATGKNFQYKPYEQASVGEPMTDEQKKEYQTYIDKIPALVKSETEQRGKDVMAVLNKIFELPFDEIFAQ